MGPHSHFIFPWNSTNICWWFWRLIWIKCQGDPRRWFWCFAVRNHQSCVGPMAETNLQELTAGRGANSIASGEKSMKSPWPTWLAGKPQWPKWTINGGYSKLPPSDYRRVDLPALMLIQRLPSLHQPSCLYRVNRMAMVSTHRSAGSCVRWEYSTQNSSEAFEAGQGMYRRFSLETSVCFGDFLLPHLITGGESQHIPKWAGSMLFRGSCGVFALMWRETPREAIFLNW